ncbi:MAG: SMP-30/gluconolactonase/LRE family protein [Spirochaetaceae bacterium]|nr:SMP-30/gluconolactonase/LRE family protein [Spirochaetaceae bacterium]
MAGPRVSNGLAWSRDGKILYYIDTPQKGVDAFDYDPEKGSITGEIIVPSANTTSCCFAGKNLDTLIITSSGEGFADFPAGCVFYAEPGIRGTPTQAYGG